MVTPLLIKVKIPSQVLIMFSLSCVLLFLNFVIPVFCRFTGSRRKDNKAAIDREENKNKAARRESSQGTGKLIFMYCCFSYIVFKTRSKLLETDCSDIKHIRLPFWIERCLLLTGEEGYFFSTSRLVGSLRMFQEFAHYLQLKISPEPIRFEKFCLASRKY